LTFRISADRFDWGMKTAPRRSIHAADHWGTTESQIEKPLRDE
jgi:hypothetical protein